MKASARLRVLTLNDVPAMHRIFNHYVAHSFAAYTEETVSEGFIRGLLEQSTPLGAIAVIGKEDQLQGFGLLRPYSPWQTFRETAFVTYFLDPNAVGQGLGTRLLAALEDAAREAGIHQLLAHVSSENPASLAFHERRGFSRCGRLHGIGSKHGKTFDVVWYEKAL